MNKYATVGQWCEKCNHVFCLSPDKHGALPIGSMDAKTSDKKSTFTELFDTPIKTAERILELEATIATLREEVERLKGQNEEMRLQIYRKNNKPNLDNLFNVID